MKRLFAALWMATAFSVATLGQDAPLRLTTKTKQTQLITQLETRLPPLMKEADVPGLSIALIRDGKLVWHRGFGVKNARTNEPVSPWWSSRVATTEPAPPAP